MGSISLAPILLAATVSMTFAEFIEVQKLSREDLRTRFTLPLECDPAVTASTTEPAANSVTVDIECRAKPAGTPPPGEPTRPGRPTERTR